MSPLQYHENGTKKSQKIERRLSVFQVFVSGPFILLVTRLGQVTLVTYDTKV